VYDFSKAKRFYLPTPLHYQMDLVPWPRQVHLHRMSCVEFLLYLLVPASSVGISVWPSYNHNNLSRQQWKSGEVAGIFAASLCMYVANLFAISTHYYGTPAGIAADVWRKKDMRTKRNPTVRFTERVFAYLRWCPRRILRIV
jgi:hypothetical protein